MLFSLTVYRDGRVRHTGRAPRGRYAAAMPAVLRDIAAAIEAGALVLSAEDEDYPLV